MLRLLARGSHFGVHVVVSSIKMKANLHTNDMNLPYLLLLKELNLFQIFAPIGHIASSAFIRIEQNIFLFIEKYYSCLKYILVIYISAATSLQIPLSLTISPIFHPTSCYFKNNPPRPVSATYM